MKEGEIIYTGKTKTGKNISIRYPQSNDTLVMCNYINTLSAERTFILYQGEHISVEEEEQFLQTTLKHIEEKKAVFLMAFLEDALVGMSQINMLTRAERHVGLFGISVAKEYRGEGIGKILMQTVLKEAEKHIPQLEIVTLGVFGNNPIAKKLYEQCGFKEYGVLPNGNYYKEEKVDHILMYKEVRS